MTHAKKKTSVNTTLLSQTHQSPSLLPSSLSLLPSLWLTRLFMFNGLLSNQTKQLPNKTLFLVEWMEGKTETLRLLFLFLFFLFLSIFNTSKRTNKQTNKQTNKHTQNVCSKPSLHYDHAALLMQRGGVQSISGTSTQLPRTSSSLWPSAWRRILKPSQVTCALFSLVHA